MKKSMISKNSLWVLLVVMIVLCAVLLTVLVERAEETFGLKMDLTTNRIYTIGDVTKEMLSKLDKEVNIYTVFKQSEEDHTIREVLRRYEAQSSNIHLENIDPLREPLLLKRFEREGQAMEDNSIIVAEAQNEENYRVISPKDLYEWQLVEDQLYATGMVLEQRITSAIRFLCSHSQTRVLFVTGHGESTEEELYYLKKAIEADDYVVQSYHLMNNDSALTNSDVLIFVAPLSDLDPKERELLEAFFQTGGKAIFLINPLVPDLPEFEKIAAGFGTVLGHDLVIEGNEERYYNNPVFLAPKPLHHPALYMVEESGVGTVMPRSRSIELSFLEGVQSQGLFETSAQSYAKVDQNTTTMEKEEKDAQGPFLLAASSTNETTGARLVLFGSSDFIATLNNARFGSNLTAFMGSLAWVSGQENTTVVIAPKSLQDPPLRITSQLQTTVLMVLLIGIIPGVLLVWGIGIYKKRMKQ